MFLYYWFFRKSMLGKGSFHMKTSSRTNEASLQPKLAVNCKAN